ncbi:M48 family metallopeptidase [Natranaerobius trueperi]|uniref:Metal-dependent hydrolase n=1 Tax=Natranaerobius trueperi TaxID=759412 RepID=A0A226BUN3_9FIRM|nr:SprT family zinc-dependent metalloprotease [Natranaerobius trueperi]OWZ82748.1 metal-dependent hydrolase [Natranaerobius trueperi]
MKIKHKGELIDITIQKRNRKTMELQVTLEGNVRILAPKNISDDDIQNWVRSRGDWVVSKMKYFQDIKEQYTDKQFKVGEQLYFLGKPYTLNIFFCDHENKVELTDNEIQVYTKSEEKEVVRETLRNWYFNQTHKLIEERIRYFQKYFKEQPTKIMVKEQKKRWGSCTSQNALYFNWRISMAPKEVLEYLVVHEMCHLKHKNHGKNFWNCVATILPDFKWRRDWLKVNGIKLNF